MKFIASRGVKGVEQWNACETRLPALVVHDHVVELFFLARLSVLVDAIEAGTRS